MLKWIIEPAISLGLFYLAYTFFLKKVAFFHANRVYLLTAIIFSLLLPHISFSPPVTIATYSHIIPEVTVTGQNHVESPQAAGSGLAISKVLIITYLIFAAMFAIRLAIRLLRLSMLTAGKKPKKYNNARIVSLNSNQAPFSFLNYIFINEALYGEQEKQKIIEHELVHINQYHTFDLLLLELLTIIQWFNPVVWLYRRSILEIHEYLADEGVIKKGTDISFYRSMLLNLQLGTEFMSPTCNFNKSLTINRVRMMTTIKPAGWNRIKFILLLPPLVFLAFMCTKNTEEISVLSDEHAIMRTADDPVPQQAGENDSNDEPVTGNLAEIIQPSGTEEAKNDEVFFIVEDMPDFRGGGQIAFRQYIAENLRYPEIAANNGIEGRVFVQFTVKADGSVADANIARGVDPSLDREALRVVMNSPEWTPGKQRGQPVNVAFTFPINFVLKNEDTP